MASKAARDLRIRAVNGDQMRRSVKRSLRLHGLDRLSLCYLHDAEHTTSEAAMGRDGAVEGPLRCKEEGLIDHLGVAAGAAALSARFVDAGLFEQNGPDPALFLDTVVSLRLLYEYPSVWAIRLARERSMTVRRARLKDVATRAGVSVSTASRVVRGDRSRPVEATTEERIHVAVRELGYRPNLAARSLARGEVASTNRTREIGVVLGTTTYKYSDPFFSRVIEGIDAEILSARRHLCFIYSVSDLDDERLLGEMMRPDVVGGLIGVALRARMLDRLVATGVTPIVVVEGPEPARGVDFVSCDKEGAIGQIMTHLWGLGHRRFTYLGTADEERARRYRAWLALAGADAAPIVETHDGWAMDAGYAAMQHLLRTPRATWPSAIVAACDSIAVGALRAAREGSVRIPDDLALVGFDDTMGAFTHPPLTTVAVQRDQLGRLAVRRLIERQRYPDEPSMRIVEATELVVRESCGAPRGVLHGTQAPPGLEERRSMA